MKKLILIIGFLILPCFCFSQVINDTQIIKSGHWIYDAMCSLAMEDEIMGFTQNTPISVGELRYYFSDINRQKLSEAGKILYDSVEDFLFNEKNLLNKDDFKVSANIIVSPELYYKSNDDIDWSFNYFYKNNPVALPFDIGFSDFYSFGAEFFLGKNYDASNSNNNFTNIPYDFDQFEFNFPRFAYGNLGYSNEKWGINATLGNEKLTVGKTKTGSIILNDTFENDAYFQLDIFNHYAKYTMNIQEIDHSTFMYWHQIDVRFFNKFKLTALEGALINNPFEIRFLVPTKVYHSYSFWKQYDELTNENYDKYYNEANCCSYLGVAAEYIPVKNIRLYFLYSMNEIQLPNEWVYKYLSYPDSFGIQLGTDIQVPSKYDGFWKGGIEFTYAVPFLYIKQSPDWSLYRSRQDMITWNYINSWIGTPFGPDTFAVNIDFSFTKLNKWKTGVNYLFKIHGENGFNLFNKAEYYNEELQIWEYYPYVKYIKAEDCNDEAGMTEAHDEGRNMWMTGTCEYLNRLSVWGEYTVNNHFSVYGNFNYSFIFNNKNINERFENGIELTAGGSWSLF